MTQIMKKFLAMTSAAIILAAVAVTPTLAAEYKIDAPDGPQFAQPTSIELVLTADNAVTESSNIDRSCAAALIPPPFGSPECGLIGSGSSWIQIPVQTSGWNAPYSGMDALLPAGPVNTGYDTAPRFTSVNGLLQADGSLGRLKIPSLGVNVKVYESESLSSLAKGVGHFEHTSCWDGNVGLAAHNRGTAAYFGEIHTLRAGDRIVYATELGTRTYEVFYVGQISETDFSHLGYTYENLITLITCVRNVPSMRWCVQARQIN